MADAEGTASSSLPVVVPSKPQLDKKLYDFLMNKLANNPVPKVVPMATSTATSSKTATSGRQTASLTTSTTPHYLWPVKNAPYPQAGALLPFNRIVAYYGNFLSTRMGVLGQYPPEEMLARLRQEVARWQAADPTTHVIPAIDYIAVTAQGSPGADGMYRARMPDTEIDKAVKLAEEVNGIVILDVQVGKSTVEKEIPLLEPYLKLPNVHLAIDPEFSMKLGGLPGKKIGTFDARDINFTANFLAGLVQKYNLPPKVLVVHRFTEDMVTNYRNIKPLPEVQIVMDADGFGTPTLKKTIYQQVIYSEPVQFAGLKLFYKNDISYGGRMLSYGEVLKLRPIPSFIQYQ